MKINKFFWPKSLEIILIVAVFLFSGLVANAEVDTTNSDSNGSNQTSTSASARSCKATWDYRVKITIDRSKVAANLVDFPIYVNLADLPADFHTNVRRNAGDIRVTKSDGKTELPREVVFYNPRTATGELHFKNTGLLSSATDTDFYIYYGNSGAVDYPASSTYGRNNVWTDYEAVYHLEDTSDSSGNERTLSQHGTTTFPAQLSKLSGRYANFSAKGGNSLYRLNDNFGLGPNDPQSWSFWYKIHNLKQDNYDHILFSKASENNGSYGWYTNFYRYTTANPLLYWTRMRGSDADGANLTESVILATSTWYHSAQTFDGSSTNEGWRNGISKGTWSSAGSYPGFSDQGFTLGGWWVPGTPGTLRGAMDEFRLFNGTYPAGWVTTEYNNHNSSATFYSVGSTETKNWY